MEYANVGNLNEVKTFAQKPQTGLYLASARVVLADGHNV